MAKKSGQSVHPMTIAQFHRYLDDRRRELEACYKEVEEVQLQFNDIFKLELEAWQERFSYCYPRIASQRQEMPAAFARVIDRTEEEELGRLRTEIADLEKQLEQGRTESDSLLAQAQSATVALREANPQLNEREEELKSLMARYQDEYAEAFEQIEALQSPFLGSLPRFAQIRKLRSAQKTARKQQASTLAQLQAVRKDWLERVEKAGDTQAELRQNWQQTKIEMSQNQARHDHLVENLEDLAVQAALQRVLEELDEPPEVPGELGGALTELVERNRVRRAYEEGLRAVAEVLGLTKGVGEGLTRFQRSVATVLQEQRRYSLKEVRVPLPQSAAVMNQVWNELAAKVKDEKHMGTHPLEFSRGVDVYIKRRLTDENIQSLFETMGEALTRATKAWD